ncbi:MAG: hypothetical protein LBP81_01635 [Treponema sp.]|jgi:hypothetical protein|nr:hypothetical protein [Treponema sp.]
MKNTVIKTLAALAALFVVFALAGCPQSHDDLLTLEEALKLLPEPEEEIIQAEDGVPSGSVTNNGAKGSGSVGNVMNELNPDGDGATNYFTITLPDSISSGSYIVKFRYASGADDFQVKFTVNDGDTVWETEVAPNNGWELDSDKDLIAPADPVELKGGDTLKVWTTDWGCIDYIQLGLPGPWIIHYSRPDGNYSDWNMWVWPAEPKGEGASYPFGEPDAKGFVTATVSLSANVSKIGFIVRKGDWLEQEGNDRFTKKREILLFSGDTKVYEAKP